MSRKKAAAKTAVKFTTAEIIAALEVSAGILSAAARKLGTDRATLSKIVESNPEITAARKRIEDEILDLAEANLIQFMNDDRHPALRQKSLDFYLRTKGKNRGYTTGTEVTGKGGAPIEAESKVTIDVSNLTAEQLAQLERSALAALQQRRNEGRDRRTAQ